MKQLQLTNIKRFADKTNGIEYKVVANNPSRLEVKVSVQGTNKHITIVKRGEVNSNKLIVSYYVGGTFHRTLTHVTTQKRTIEFIEHLLSEVEQVSPLDTMYDVLRQYNDFTLDKEQTISKLYSLANTQGISKDDRKQIEEYAILIGSRLGEQSVKNEQVVEEVDSVDVLTQMYEIECENEELNLSVEERVIRLMKLSDTKGISEQDKQFIYDFIKSKYGNKVIEIKTSHSTITGVVLQDLINDWVLGNVSIIGISEERNIEKYAIPKGMAWSYKYID